MEYTIYILGNNNYQCLLCLNIFSKLASCRKILLDTQKYLIITLRRDIQYDGINVCKECLYVAK